MNNQSGKNEYLNLLLPSNLLDAVEGFRENYRFLYPKNGESFVIRFLGDFKPYLRTYLKPDWYLSGKLSHEEIKKCLLGDKSVILNVSIKLLSQYPSLNKFYSIEKDSINVKLNVMRSTYDNNTAEMQTFDFVQKCNNSNATRWQGVWSSCLIVNAYVKSPSNSYYFNGVYPVAINKTMFASLVNVPYLVSNPFANISGINALDFILSKGEKFITLSAELTNPLLLSSGEICSIVRQGVFDIPKFVKKSNSITMENYQGFIYRPQDSLKDFEAIQRITESFSPSPENEELEIAERDLCNLPEELSCCEFENGAIGSLEII